MNECRDAYLNEIVQAVYDGEDVYLVAADLAAPCLDKLREDFPQRYVPVGIAEQNLISVSSGLALAGKKVVVYTMIPFLVFRAFDQIRNCVGLMNIKLALMGIGAGFNYSKDGISHFPLEDLSILRGTPNLTIYNVSCTNLARYCGQKTLKLDAPIYVRTDRLISQAYDLSDADISCGYRFLNAVEGKVCVVATGIMASECLDVLKSRADFAEKVSLIDLFAFPFDAEKLACELKNYSQIITVEEMRLQGGMGGAVLESLADSGVNIPLVRMGVDISKNLNPHYGSRDWHLKQFGLDKNSIAEKISTALEAVP